MDEEEEAELDRLLVPLLAVGEPKRELQRRIARLRQDEAQRRRSRLALSPRGLPKVRRPLHRVQQTLQLALPRLRCCSRRQAGD